MIDSLLLTLAPEVPDRADTLFHDFRRRSVDGVSGQAQVIQLFLAQNAARDFLDLPRRAREVQVLEGVEL
jgi:hypothetical protein